VASEHPFEAEPRVAAESHVTADLLAEVAHARPGEPFWVAVRLRMDEHWHTYWKNPGDSGLSTRVLWDLPPEIEAGELHWPFPRRFETPPLVSFGYEGEVLLLTEMRWSGALNREEPRLLTIGARVDWLVCREECLPGEADLRLALPVRADEPRPDERWVELFGAARSRLPRDVPGWRINALADRDHIRLQIFPPRGFQRELERILFFPEQAGLINHEAPETSSAGDVGYRLELGRSRLSDILPERLRGVLYVDSGWDAGGRVKALSLDVPLHRVKKKPGGSS
jgi:thiol:disulfide interchange protein DsbD